MALAVPCPQEPGLGDLNGKYSSSKKRRAYNLKMISTRSWLSQVGSRSQASSWSAAESRVSRTSQGSPPLPPASLLDGFPDPDRVDSRPSWV